MLRRINDALPGLVLGILIYGVLIQVTGVWFVEDKLDYSIGLWYGIAIAIGMAINLAKVIYDVVTFTGENNAGKFMAAKSMLRYLAAAVLLFILGYFEIGNIIMACVGMFGLKISAYMQPILMKIVHKSSKTNLDFDGEDKENKENKEVTM